MSKFDEFKLHVLDSLILWDEKSAELASLANRYYGALEEQKKTFIKLKLVVQEKDQMIGELQRQLVMREQNQEIHFDSMKAELMRSNKVMKEELLGTVKLMEALCLQKEDEIKTGEKRMLSFRCEFNKVTDERNYLEEEFDKLKTRFDEVDHAYITLKNSVF